MRTENQKLIDIMFQIAMVLHSGCNTWAKDWSDENIAEWIRDQLKICGFDTVPMGASWGVLK